jgi:hypothetical protein
VGLSLEVVTQILAKYQRQPRGVSGIDSIDGTEDILDDVYRAGIGGGFGVALLVGGGGHDPAVGVKLVGRLPE